MRACLPYLASLLVHGGFLATLHWACQGPAPAQYALQAGDARIELLLTLPSEAPETPTVQITPPEPTVVVERKVVEPPRPAPETPVFDVPSEIAAAVPQREAAVAEEPATAEPPRIERNQERSPVAATPAAWQAPATAGATVVDELPQKLPRNPAPAYPAAAYSARQEGVVLVRVQISAAGVVAEARLEVTSGFALLDQSALETVRLWKFAPARRAGVAVPHEILVPVRFQLSARRAV